MFKQILVIASAIALTGCATHQQSNQALGAALGGAVGYHAIGGSAGTAIGSVLGAVIGSNQPVHNHRQGSAYSSSHAYPDYSVCNQWNWPEREACYRGAEARARQEQARKVQQAYQQGYSGR